MTNTPKKKCAICGKPQVEKYRPFCSSRCASIDLNRWLGGQYAIPAVEEPDDWSEEDLQEEQVAHDNDN
ncbi:MAG: DNA gyrase inhibitor YacG [Alphaproteobacteria bacterium]